MYSLAVSVLPLDTPLFNSQSLKLPPSSSSTFSFSVTHSSSFSVFAASQLIYHCLFTPEEDLLISNILIKAMPPQPPQPSLGIYMYFFFHLCMGITTTCLRTFFYDNWSTDICYTDIWYTTT